MDPVYGLRDTSECDTVAESLNGANKKLVRGETARIRALSSSGHSRFLYQVLSSVNSYGSS